MWHTWKKSNIFKWCNKKTICSQAVKHLRTPEFKPYVIFVKPLIPEQKKHVLKPPMSEEISAPLVSILTFIYFFIHERSIWARISVIGKSSSSMTARVRVEHSVGSVHRQPFSWDFRMRFLTPLKLASEAECTSSMWICVYHSRLPQGKLLLNPDQLIIILHFWWTGPSNGGGSLVLIPSVWHPHRLLIRYIQNTAWGYLKRTKCRTTAN